VDAHQDEQDVEFEAFLRQFQPRTPPALKVCHRVTLTQLAMAAAVLLVFAIPLRLSREKAAGQNSTGAVDLSLTSKPADAVKTVAPDGASKLASPSAAGAPARTAAAGSPRPGAVAQYGPIRVGGVIKPPTRVFSVNAIYPEEAKAAGVEGVVVMRIIIGEDGSVTNVVVVRSVPMLDEAAIESVLQWQYQPTLLNGVPVEVEMFVTVSFTLR
jgi:eukaryotic-like serine/threonine-protein kinase